MLQQLSRATKSRALFPIPSTATVKSRAVKIAASAAAALVSLMPQTSFAAAAAIPQLGTMETFIGTLISVFCYIACIVLVGMAAWEYMQSRKLAVILSEVVGAVVVVIIAFNGNNIATSIGLTAASVTGHHIAPVLSL